MNEKLRAQLDKLFVDAPPTRRAAELKEELLANLTDRYNDLISQGLGEEDALRTVLNGIGDVDELIRGLRETDVMDYKEMYKQRQKTAIVVTTAVGMYVLGVILLILGIVALHIQPIIMVSLMLLLFLLATLMLIYHFMSRPKYVKADDTMVEEFKEWKSHTSSQARVRSSISSILWTLTTAVYLLISFVYGIWGYSWIIFIIAAAVDKIIKLSFELREEKHE